MSSQDVFTPHDNPVYDYVQSEEQKSGHAQTHDVVIVGAGPMGLAMALDCADRGIHCVILDDNNTVSVGSRALCFSKRSLEIMNRLGVADRILDKGVKWQVGKNYFKEALCYEFNLLPEEGHQMPAMVNIQQYYVEEFMVDACNESEFVDLRWKHRVEHVEQHADHVTLTITTPDGEFKTNAKWLIACDGASSSMRGHVNAQFDGRVFDDQFLIADIIMKNEFPKERWFWFDPPFHPGQSVLLHKAPHDMWRIDFQLGSDADTEYWKNPENVRPLLKSMLGEDIEFTFEWLSVYRFACRRMEKFCHNRIIFAGDSAHQVSPFGARGANTGLQDIDNLGWKLQLVLQGKAPESLVNSYDDERIFAADINIMNSTRSTDFLTPKSKTSKIMRDAVLSLAGDYEFARPLVNSGRLSVHTNYEQSILNTGDDGSFVGDNSHLTAPGALCPDAEIKRDGKPAWLLEQLGQDFVALIFANDTDSDKYHIPLNVDGIVVKPLVINRDIKDEKGYLKQRFDDQEGSVYLIRPDQHIAGRWREYNKEVLSKAVKRATANV